MCVYESDWFTHYGAVKHCVHCKSTSHPPLPPVSYTTDHRRLLLHTEVRWLLKGNCLKRFMELFEPLSEFLKDKYEMMLVLLMTTDGKASVSYLANIFEKVFSSNKQLHKPMQHFTMQKQRYLGLWHFSVCAETIFCHYVQFSWLKACDNTK